MKAFLIGDKLMISKSGVLALSDTSGKARPFIKVHSNEHRVTRKLILDIDIKAHDNLKQIKLIKNIPSAVNFDSKIDVTSSSISVRLGGVDIIKVSVCQTNQLSNTLPLIHKKRLESDRIREVYLVHGNFCAGNLKFTTEEGKTRIDYF